MDRCAPCAKMGEVYHRSRAAAAAVLVIAVAFTGATISPAARDAPLWPGGRYSRADRIRALDRGLQFLDRIAHDPKVFASWGGDLLSAFYNIYETSLDPRLSAKAWSVGHERALAWQRTHRSLPAEPDAGAVSDAVYGLDAAEHLGAPNPQLRAQLSAAATRFAARDFLLWDPAAGPPPRDMPERCPSCGDQNERGTVTCKRCGARLAMRNRYDLYQDALIATYTGETAGIPLGARYRDVLNWLPEMRPYPEWSPSRQTNYYAAVYSITHLVYTYNSYSKYRVSRECFPGEFAYLQANLPHAIADQDPEMLGEYLDALRAFGLTLDDQPIRTGFNYLLSTQNSDGSWGDPTDPSAYDRYHTTWTAIDGLRDYRWTETRVCPGGSIF